MFIHQGFLGKWLISLLGLGKCMVGLEHLTVQENREALKEDGNMSKALGTNLSFHWLNLKKFDRKE